MKKSLAEKNERGKKVGGEGFKRDAQEGSAVKRLKKKKTEKKKNCEKEWGPLSASFYAGQPRV